MSHIWRKLGLFYAFYFISNNKNNFFQAIESIIASLRDNHNNSINNNNNHITCVSFFRTNFGRYNADEDEDGESGVRGGRFR